VKPDNASLTEQSIDLPNPGSERIQVANTPIGQRGGLTEKDLEDSARERGITVAELRDTLSRSGTPVQPAAPPAEPDEEEGTEQPSPQIADLIPEVKQQVPLFPTPGPGASMVAGAAGLPSDQQTLREMQVAKWYKAIEAKPSDSSRQVYLNGYFTGDIEQGQIEYEAMMDADIVFATADANGIEYPGAVVNGLQDLEKSKALIVQEGDDLRIHKMLRRGSLIIGHIVPLDSKAEGTIERKVNGEPTRIAITYLDKWFENAELTGQKPSDYGVVTSEPSNIFGQIMQSLFRDDENKKLRQARRLTALGINPVVQNQILNAADRGIVLADRRGETFKDFGKGVYNNMLALSIGDFEYVFGETRQDPLTARQRRDARLGKDRVARLEGREPDFEKPEVAAYGSAVASHILNNILIQEPDKANVEGDKLDSRYHVYFKDQVATGLGITPEQSELFLRMNGDIFEGGITFTLEAAPITAGLGVFSIGRGILSTAPKFQRWATKKFGTENYDDAIKIANSRGFTTATLERQFAEESMDLIGFNRLKFIRETRVEGMSRRLRVAAELKGDKGSLEAISLERVGKIQKRYEDELSKLRAINPYSVKGAAEYSKQLVKVGNLGRQNLMSTFRDREFPSALYDETKLEFGFAYGAAVTGETIAASFGESYRGLGEFGGALMSFTLYAPALKALKSNVTGRLVFGTYDVGIQIPKMRKLYVSMLKGLGELDPDQDADDYFARFVKGSTEREVQELLLDNASPTFKKMLVEQAKSYKQMTESLLEITLPNGERAFNEEEILTLLANVTQIGVLRSYGEELNSVMNVQKLTGKKYLSDELLQVKSAEAKVSQQISEVLSKFDSVADDSLSPATKNFVDTFRQTVREEQQRVDRDYNEAVRAHEAIEEEYNNLVLSGRPMYDTTGELLDVNDIPPENFISSSYKSTVAKYIGDDGVITDMEAFEAEVVNKMREATELRQEELRELRNIGESSEASIRAVEDAKNRYHNQRALIDIGFRNLESFGTDFKADAGALITLLRGETGLKALDESLADINFGIEVNSDLAARSANIGKLKGPAVRNTLLNKLSLEFFRDSPQFSAMIAETAGKNIEDMDFNEIQGTVKVIADSIYERTDIPTDIRNMFGTGAPQSASDLYIFFNEVMRNKNLAESLGFPFDERVMRTGVSSGALREIVGFLGKNVDPNSPSGIALMRVRNTIKNNIMKGYKIDEKGDVVLDAAGNPVIDPDAGFRRNFYSSEPEDVSGEYRAALEEVDSIYGEHLARYHNKNVPTHGVINATVSEGDAKVRTAIPDIITAAITESKKKGANKAGVMTDMITANFARLFPDASVAVRDDTGKITTFVIDGTSDQSAEAIEEMKNTIKEYALNEMFNSDWGREFRKRSTAGQIYGLNMSEGKITQLENVLGEGKIPVGAEPFTDENIISTIESLSKIGVKTVDENGVETVRPLITEEELWDPFRFETFSQSTKVPAKEPTVPRRGKGRSRERSAEAVSKEVIGDLKAELKNVEGDLSFTKETRSRLLNNLKEFQKQFGKDRPEAVFSSMLETTDGMEGLRRVKQRTIERRVNGGLSVDEATKQTELEYKNIIFENMLYTALPDSTGGLQKFLELTNKRVYMDNLRELSPEAADNIAAMGTYLGNYAKSLGDSTDGIKLRGLASPFNQVSEVSRLFAVWSGRVGYTFYGTQLLASAGIRARQASFKALLDDPEAGKVLIDLLTGTKPPTEKQSATLYKAFLTYSARDYALYSDGDYYTSISEFIGSTVAGTASATVQTGADFLFSEQEQPVVIPGSMPRPVTPSQRREQILRERQQGAQ